VIRTLSVASIIALLPAAAVAQEMTDSELHTKSLEADKAAAMMAGAPAIGLADGVQAPSVTLVDTNGTAQTFASLAGAKGTVVAFVRSADWCPYCKKQLVELEAAAVPLADAGWTLVVVSYDPIETLAAFKAEKGLSYALLSDDGSGAIKAFNLLNTDMKPGSRYEGIPHPAIIFIGADGRIEKTLREDGYKNRPATDLVIETAEGL